MNHKPTFFSSDWHIGHEKSIEFDERPFKNLDEMHEALITRYNSTVPNNGICYFLGDMGNKTEDIRKVVKQLKGTKVLILGNHDKGITTMYNCGFDVVVYSATLYIGKHRITMSHCPLLGVFREDISHLKERSTPNWHGEGRETHIKCSLKNEGQFHLSGHIHSRIGKNTSKTQLHRQFDVGVCAHKFTPVSISEIESWISKTIKLENDWRDIPDFQNYKVNYFGQIKSFLRYPEGKLIRPYIDKDGYKCCSLRQNNKPKSIKVHRAVALAFLDNPHNLPQVNHKNCHKQDNEVSNLEWISNEDNQKHAWLNDRKTKSFTVADVKNIKSLLNEGKSNTEISKIYNVDQSSISNIKTGKVWKDV